MTGMTGRQMAGAAILVAPFIALFVFGIIALGPLEALALFGGVAVLVLVLHVGMRLLTDERP